MWLLSGHLTANPITNYGNRMTRIWIVTGVPVGKGGFGSSDPGRLGLNRLGLIRLEGRQ
jgi:hypothetical protein